MMRRLRAILFASCMLVTLGLSAQPYASAQSSIKGLPQPDKSALAVSPAIIEHVLEPGAKKDFTLRVTNLTSFPLPISGTVKNFVTLGEFDNNSKQAAYDASKWFTISEPDFILQPKQTRSVYVSIIPPPTAEPGGHYATVYFQPLLPEGALTPSTSYLSARVGSLAFLIVPGQIQEKLSIRQFTTARIHQLGPVEFNLTLTNGGNVHLAPNSKVEIRNILGNKVAEISGHAGVVVPGTTKEVAVTLQKSLPLGRYTATATTSFGAERDEAKAVAVFWVIPWTFWILFPGSLFIVVVAFRTRGRWRKAWHILRGKAL